MDSTIRIINDKFEFLGDIEDYSSFFCIRNFFLAKEFQLICSSKYKGILKDGNILFINSNTPFLIEDITSNENKRQVIVKGKDLKSILNRRITVPNKGQAYDSFKGNAEDVIKHYIDVNMVNPVDPNRKIEELVVAESKHRGKIINWQSRYKSVDSEVANICGTTGLGCKIILDLENRKFVFDVMEGRNLTDSNQKVIFDEDFDNITNVVNTRVSTNYKSMCYVGGQGEKENREVKEIYKNNDIGLNRRELFIDARDIEENEHEKLEDRANAKLKNYDLINSTESTVLNNNFIYKKDWDLGDIVVRKIDNDYENLRVTEITEVYEKFYKVDITLGNCIPGLLNKD